MCNKNQSEEDCSCYVKSLYTKKVPPCRAVTHPLRYYEFTQDEIRVLEECDRESFYQRCVPLSSLFATFTYAAVRGGFLRRSLHFGPVPKIVVAALLGHIAGRLSYINKCDSKIREKLTDNSHLGETMRKYYLEAHPPPPKKK